MPTPGAARPGRGACDTVPMSLEPTGIIYLAATPIGNPGDASVRLREMLAEAELIAAEDTRRLRGLCSRLDITPPGRIIAFHDHVEEEKANLLVQAAKQGQTVLVVSDAGTPTVSDPGYRLSRAAAKAGVRVSPLPGPSAALAALSVSGLPTDRFTFEGFLPVKKADLMARLTELQHEPRTMVLFESPRRTARTLRSLAEVLGEERPAALCRELTKTHEEVLRGTLQELRDHAQELEILGEVTLVIQGAPKRAAENIQGLATRAVRLSERDGLRLKDAAAQVALGSGHRPNAVFKAALELT